MKDTADAIVKVRKPLRDTSGRLEETLQKSLHSYWAHYASWRKLLISDGSRKAVHQLRTSIRKLLSMLDILTVVKNTPCLDRLSRSLQKELKTLSELRDIQVQRKEGHHGPVYLRTEAFDRHLKGLENKILKTVRYRFRHWSFQRREQAFSEVEDALKKALKACSENKRIKVLADIVTFMDQNYKELLRLRLDLQVDDDKSFHKFRIGLKDYRYKLVALDPLFSEEAGLTENIEALRKGLGQLQDKVTLFRYSKKYLKKSLSHPHPKRELRKRILRRQKQLLEESLHRLIR